MRKDDKLYKTNKARYNLQTKTTDLALCTFNTVVLVLVILLSTHGRKLLTPKTFNS